MKRSWTILLIVVAGALLTLAASVRADTWGDRFQTRHARRIPWHNTYYDAAWGMPVALVVPPRTNTQTHWSWGVSGTYIDPVYHQFHRDWPVPGVYDRRGFQPAPPQPSSTDQSGINYVRGPRQPRNVVVH